jgi:membrane-associated PAP2 superfamily phosphatase
VTSRFALAKLFFAHKQRNPALRRQALGAGFFFRLIPFYTTQNSRKAVNRGATIHAKSWETGIA